jgi:hypothetical protein
MGAEELTFTLWGIPGGLLVLFLTNGTKALAPEVEGRLAVAVALGWGLLCAFLAHIVRGTPWTIVAIIETLGTGILAWGVATGLYDSEIPKRIQQGLVSKRKM